MAAAGVTALDHPSFTMNSTTSRRAGNDFAQAAIVVLLTLCYHAATGFQTLVAAGGDNDSLLRMVEVRDLIGGQGWFDLHQYRMGPDGGFVMHWSRFVDAPLAAIVLAVSAVTGSIATGEVVAQVAWPMLLMWLALATLLRIARRIDPDWSALPMLTVGGTSLYFIGVFKPGDIDHHNVQLVLTLVAVAALATSQGFKAGLVAGVASALMLAVGMETLPYVAVAGLVAAVGFLIGAQGGAEKASGFAAGFAGFGLLAFVATVPADAWFAAQCDAYSIPQFSIALLAGAGLAGAASIDALRRSFTRRLVALAMLGAIVAALVVVFFPQCLAGPYSGLDPRLQKFWLDSVSEAQPLWKILATDPSIAVAYYVTPLIALVLLAWQMRTTKPTQAGVVILAFLAVAVLVSIWQVRGSIFSVSLATIPLARWVGAHRRGVASGTDKLANIRLVVAWLLSLNVVWAGIGAVGAATVQTPDAAEAEAARQTCDRAADYALLGTMPNTTVLAISNLGAPILFHTGHRVLAGPYHRNIEGDLAALDALMGSDAEAAGVAKRYHVGLVALCRGNSETSSIAAWAPAGLLAALVADRAPNWLERLPETEGKPLELFRVLQGN